MAGDVKRIKHDGGIDAVKTRLDNGTIKVGLLAGLGVHPNSDEGLTIPDVGAVNEFGMGNIPERSFLRSTMSEKRGEYKQAMIRLLALIIKGKVSGNRAFEILGLQAARDVQRKIDEITDPPNSQRTIDAKGSDKPLIDTGLLRKSVSWGTDA